MKIRLSTIIAATIALVAITYFTDPEQADAAYKPVPDQILSRALQSKPPARGTVGKRAWAVCRVWRGVNCRAVLNVAWCESTLRPWARNGQYAGIFQMGSSERARFGHGRSTWAQARAARGYFLVSGFAPWECRP